jgi:hypothetical protein
MFIDSPPVAAATKIFLGAQVFGSTSATPSFTITATHPTATRRIFIAVVSGRPSGTGNQITSMTIGGVSATRAFHLYNGSGTYNAIYYANVPSGTSLAVAITFSGTLTDSGTIIFPYEIDGLTNNRVNVFGPVSGNSTSVTTTGKAYIIASHTGFKNGGGSDVWSGTAGLIEDADQPIATGSTLWGSVASLAANGAISGGTVIATPTSSNANTIGGVWMLVP